METRVAVVSIIIEAGSDVEKVNALLHEFAPYILGRMGIPYRPSTLSPLPWKRRRMRSIPSPASSDGSPA